MEDLGSQGEWPSHPELLDWLAVEFRDSGWDMKHIVRLMVTSAAYRQDSQLLPDLRDLDPNNRWLTSQNPRRLEAEFVRDNALSIAGLINLDIGGPSCQALSTGRILRQYSVPRPPLCRRHDEREYRRGIYMHWQRTFLHPMLANFDAPSREDCVCTRSRFQHAPAGADASERSRVCRGRQGPGRSRTGADQKDEAPLGVHLPAGFGRSIRPKEADSLKQFLAVATELFQGPRDRCGKLLKTGLFQVRRRRRS